MVTVEVPAHWKVKQMLIGELAQRSGVPAKTLRYYEDIGLLAPPRRTESGYRDYDPDVGERLTFITSSSALGLTLGEIRSIIALRDDGHVPCSHVLALLEQHSRDIERRIRDLRSLKVELAAIVERGAQLDPADCDPDRICHLITS
jgi:DNA-binding transcriptional MerR regulator